MKNGKKDLGTKFAFLKTENGHLKKQKVRGSNKDMLQVS